QTVGSYDLEPADHLQRKCLARKSVPLTARVARILLLKPLPFKCYTRIIRIFYTLLSTYVGNGIISDKRHLSA
ncbi:hypothetical protein, partial [Haematobacter missouriensis]|uniref:hypothetical protein n=1 Tax=Haematobacter missouriensis TaxID=366616 RepID=UPI001E47DD5C